MSAGLGTVARFVLLVLAGLVGMHALQWANCPVCGRGHSTISPGAPCSSGCAAKQGVNKHLGDDTRDAEPDYGRGGGRRGKDVVGGGGGGQHRKSGWCQLRLLEIVAAPAALAVLAVHLVRRGRR